MATLFQAACSGKIVKNSLRIALVVGSILNLVNQGDAILAGTGVSWIHMALNYLVPYCVASYSAAKIARLDSGPATGL
ncbi:nitrate/nitrite transporter NrtS [Rhodoferax sp.]|uniref:nitrate/nitrite transporter NrtS n=1 Tax=Rhodoferax sp. TaxID=50421 RepID=UPI0019DF3B7B|nr:nitrate/nitrite transporter NrtS [Rhodoferax sp.]MBE0473235.1 nitrate/nitrite transporter NrtS [Rhodoferax sp.]